LWTGTPRLLLATRLSEGSAAATTSTSLDAFSSSVCQNAVSEPKIATVDRPWAASFGRCTAGNNSISRPSSGGTTHTNLAITRQGQKLGAANTLPNSLRSVIASIRLIIAFVHTSNFEVAGSDSIDLAVRSHPSLS